MGTFHIHLVFSSHWDREWYLPFQQFRSKLVKVLDRVLEELESGRLPSYQMDGQFVPVEDYLQIRPEKETLLRRLVAEGKFLVGPWYTIPDEFLVSGESLVRNLQMGLRRAERFGRTSRAGWLCDLFGHNSQMPQILNLLGLHDALIWRGVPEELAPPFRWQSSDGSEVLAHVFGHDGYCDFGFQVRDIHSPTPSPTAQEMAGRAWAYWEKWKGPGTERVLWVDGADHIEFDPAVLEMIDIFNRKAGHQAISVSTLDEFLMTARKETRRPSSPWKGELRAAARTKNAWLIPGAGSSRIPLKQVNHACETLLTLWTEPWCALAQEETGLKYPTQALELAWEYLLKNHPHDSICGCSTDATHAAMPYRFDQCQGLAEAALDDAFHKLSAQALQPLLQDGEIGLSLFTPHGGDLQATPEVLVRLPRKWPSFKEYFGFEPKPSFRIYTQEGAEVPYQLLQVIPQTKEAIIDQYKMPRAEPCQGVRLALDTTVAPAQARHLVIRQTEGPTRIGFEPAIGIAANCLRNAHVEVVAESNGTISLTDLANGRVYRNLLQLEDTADIGDGWFHGDALQERSYLSTGGKVALGLTENGPLLARLHLRIEWEVPEEFLFDRNMRSERLTPLVVEHVVTLRRGSRYAEVQTTIHNTVRDHRLRLLCPTGLAEAQTYTADSPFDAVSRPIALHPERHLWKELQVDTTPQQNWVAISQERCGLALLAPGQYESSVLDQPGRPICLTLLRAFRRAVFTDGNEGGQIQGTHRFTLALAPFQTKMIPAAQLSKWAQKLAAPVRAKISAHRAMSVHHAPEKPARKIGIEGDVVFSASYSDAEGQRVFRFYNPSWKAVPVRLVGGRKWQEEDLCGKRCRILREKTYTAGAAKVVTLRAWL